MHWYGFFIFGCLDPWIFGFIVFMKCRQFSTTFLNIILFHISPFFSGPPITHVLDYLMLLHSFSQYSFFLYFILNNNNCIIISRSMQHGIAAKDVISFSFMAEKYSIVYIYSKIYIYKHLLYPFIYPQTLRFFP